MSKIYVYICQITRLYIHIPRMPVTCYIYICTYLPYHMMTSSNGNIFRVTGPLCEEFTGFWWIPLTKTRSFDVFFDLHLNKLLSKQSRRRWFQAPSRSSWCQYNVRDGSCCWISEIYTAKKSAFVCVAHYVLRYVFILFMHKWEICVGKPGLYWLNWNHATSEHTVFYHRYHAIYNIIPWTFCQDSHIFSMKKRLFWENCSQGCHMGNMFRNWVKQADYIQKILQALKINGLRKGVCFKEHVLITAYNIW